MIRRRFKYFMPERNEFSTTGEETLLSVSEYYGVKPRSEAFEADAAEGRAASLVGYRKVKANDFVMNYMLAWKGAYGVSGHDGIVSPAYAVYKIDPKYADRRFIHHRLRSEHMRSAFRARSKGIIESRLRLYPDAFLSMELELPDLDTQKAIADFLDSETARIDQLIEKKQRLVGLLGEKLDRTVRAYLTGEAEYPDQDQRCPTGIGYLPSAPKHWSVEKVGWRYEIQLGKMLDGAKQTGEHLRRYLRVADVQWGKINIDDLPEMDFSPSDRKRFRLQRGDLLVNEGGSYVGRSAVWRSDEQEVYYQKALHRVRPINTQRDTAEFLYYLMRFATKYGVFIAGGNQTTIDHLTAESFGRYRFAFPTLDEQKEISERLKSEEARHEEISGKINASIDRLIEYRAALITAAVTGQIDVATWDKQGQTDRRLDGSETASPVKPVSLNADPSQVRRLVAAEIIHDHRNVAYLGRIKVHKIMFLAEAHANINEINGRYRRQAAGPFDGAMIDDVEAGLRQDRFYDAAEDPSSQRGRIIFTPLDNAGGHKPTLEAILGDRVVELRRVIGLVQDFSTENTEAIATLYAVWNDALIDGEQPDNDRIIRGFREEWHEAKQRFTEENLSTWLDWMRRNDLVPRGSGPRTISAHQPSLL